MSEVFDHCLSKSEDAPKRALDSREVRSAIGRANNLEELRALLPLIQQTDDVSRELLQRYYSKRATELRSSERTASTVVSETQPIVADVLGHESDGKESDEDDYSENLGERTPVVSSLSTLLDGQAKIGQGAIASVYRAELPGYGPVIVKVGEEGQEEFFERDKRVLRAVKGKKGFPQLVEYDFEDEKTPFVLYQEPPGAMPILSDTEYGKAHLHPDFAALETEEKERFLMEFAELLAELHSSGISHGDLGGDHLLVYKDPEGFLRPYLIDFGLARFDDDEPEKSPAHLQSMRTQLSAQKIRYLTGDVVEGRERDKTAEVQVAAWMFYEALVGNIPAYGVKEDVLKKAGASPDMIAKIKTAAGPRSDRYSDMVEFVNNPFAKCADAMAGDVISKSYLDTESPYYIRDPYVQQAVINHLFKEDEAIAPNNIRILLQIIGVAPSGERHILIEKYEQLLDSEDEEVLSEALAAMDIQIANFRMQTADADTALLYKKGRDMLLAGVYPSGTVLHDLQLRYFNPRSTVEMAFNQGLQEKEKRLFFSLLKSPTSLDRHVVSRVIANNLYRFSGEELCRLRPQVETMMSEEPSAYGMKLLDLMQTSQHKLQSKPEDAPEFSDLATKKEFAQGIIIGSIANYVLTDRVFGLLREDYERALRKSVLDGEWPDDLAKLISNSIKTDGEKLFDRLQAGEIPEDIDAQDVPNTIVSLWGMIPTDNLCQVGQGYILGKALEHLELGGFENDQFHGEQGKSPESHAMTKIMVTPHEQYGLGEINRLRKVVLVDSDAEHRKSKKLSEPSELCIRQVPLLKLFKISKQEDHPFREQASQLFLEAVEEICERTNETFMLDEDSLSTLYSIYELTYHPDLLKDEEELTEEEAQQIHVLQIAAEKALLRSTLVFYPALALSFILRVLGLQSS